MHQMTALSAGNLEDRSRLPVTGIMSRTFHGTPPYVAFMIGRRGTPLLLLSWVPRPRGSSFVCYPSIAFRSSSGVVMGLMSKFFTSTSSTLWEMKAGRLGPRRIPLIPKCKSVGSTGQYGQDRSLRWSGWQRWPRM